MYPLFLARRALFASLLLTIVRSSDDISTSWEQLRIIPNELCSMPYGNFRVKVYEHANNKMENVNSGDKKYFYAPIVLLDHNSAFSYFDNIQKQAEIRFRIEMWNEKIENEVRKYLSKVVGHQLNDHQVQIIPLEKVVLTSMIPSTAFYLTTHWLPYQLQKSLQFSLSCFKRKVCDHLAVQMRSNPEQLGHFKLLFGLTSQVSQTRDIIIGIDNILSGKMVSNLLQQFDQDAQEVFLTANDEKRLLMEMTSNVIVDALEDLDVVSSISETEIYNVLKEWLSSKPTTIKEQLNKMWELVFWSDDSYRPDKICQILNKIFEKLDVESQRNMSDLYQDSDRIGNGEEADFLELVSTMASIKTDFPRHGYSSIEDLTHLYQESKEYVVWDGDTFVPKPLTLSKVNLTRLRDKQSLQERSVRLRYSTAVLSTPINFVQHADLTITDEWHNLQVLVANLTRELNETRANFTSELQARTSHMENIDKIPTSCADLRRIGHIKSGLFLVMGNEMIETVYCNFTKTDNFGTYRKMKTRKYFLKMPGYANCFNNRYSKMDCNPLFIHGYADVKSLPCYFYVQRNYGFDQTETPIPFDREVLNVGGAMNLTSGIFTATRTGKYFFSFTGLAFLPGYSSSRVYINIVLYKESDLIQDYVGRGYSDENNIEDRGYETFSLQSILHLKVRDNIWLQINGMSHGVYLSGGAYTHFNGWLLQEEISQSL